MTIALGPSNPSQQQNFVPKEVRAELGRNNKITWTNLDSVPHSVTSDNDYKDKANGKLDSLSTVGLVVPKQSYNFTFTDAGVYPYHCKPHPWMKGKIVIVAK